MDIEVIERKILLVFLANIEAIERKKLAFLMNLSSLVVICLNFVRMLDMPKNLLKKDKIASGSFLVPTYLV